MSLPAKSASERAEAVDLGATTKGGGDEETVPLEWVFFGQSTGEVNKRANQLGGGGAAWINLIHKPPK